MANEAGQICPACSANNLLVARRCEVCGADLPGQSIEALRGASEFEPLNSVPSEGREQMRTFDRQEEAELAAGLLRANGIAAEIGAPLLPGLAHVVLWVSPSDLNAAERLLAEADAGTLEAGED